MKQLILSITITFVLLLSATCQTNDIIERIDPPNWWAGMKTSELQLLIKGENIGNFTPEITYDGVTLGNFARPDNADYLILNLTLDFGVKPGEMPIRFSKGETEFTIMYELKARTETANRQQGLGPEDVIYLIMPDRFANGNTKNDNIEGYLDKVNRKEPYGRHGGDLEGIISKLDYLQDLGVTAIWLTPFQDNNMPMFSYHGYAFTDYYKTDPRLGTNEDYKRMVEEAHKRGIKVVIDIVFNQVGTEHYLVKELPMHNWLNQFDEYTQTHFVGETQPDYHASKADRDIMIKGWFHATMPDMNQQNPFVAKYQKQFVTWWLEYANIDAIRFDTYQYNDKSMLADWAKEIREEYPELYIVAEVWINNPALLAYWQENGPGDYESHVPAVFDFSMYYALECFISDKSIHEVYQVIASDFLYSNAAVNMTFINNHDLQRVYDILGKDLAKMKMVTAFLLTTRGIPQIYYGDEILMTGVEGQPYNHGTHREDFPGGWPGDKTDAFEESGRNEEQNEYFNYLKHLLNWRKNNSEFVSGELIHFIPREEVYVFFRKAGDKSLMVVLNKNNKDIELETARFNEVLNKHSEAVDIFSGEKTGIEDKMNVPAMSATILELY
jgi:glycosidase